MTPESLRRVYLPTRKGYQYGQAELSTGHGIPRGHDHIGPRIYGVTVLWCDGSDKPVYDHEASKCFNDHEDSPEWPIDRAGGNYRAATEYLGALA